MSFNKRFICDDSLVNAARKTFPDFNRYMTNADGYINEGKYAPSIWEIYDRNKDIRTDIWWILSLDYLERETLLESLADLWKSIDRKESIDDKIPSFLKISEDCLECPAQKIQNIINTIKNKYGKSTFN
jgi:hypothetical protein